MKSLLLILLGCLLISVGAQAAQLDNGVEPGLTPAHVTWNHARYPVSITQNSDPSTIDAGGYACGNTTSPNYYTTDDWAMRRFIFSDDAINTAFTLQSVDWATRYFRYGNLVAVPAGNYSIDCFVYSIATTDPILFANFTQLADVSIPLDPSYNCLCPHTTAVSAVINDTVNEDMVVAFFAPITYYLTPQFRFTVGASNAPGDTRECYYAFADCGYADPATPTDLGGAGQAKMVEVLNGDVFEPPPNGACCAADGSCTVTMEADCLTPSIWHGEWVTCDVAACPQPAGTCCDPATGACTFVLRTECVNGVWTMGGGCVPNPCEQPAMGACCYVGFGDCTITTQHDCIYTWLGPNTLCNVQTCPPPPPTGACCNTTSGVCTVTTQAACGFQWLGAGVVCNVQTCPIPVPVEHKSWGQVKHQYR